MSVLISPPPSAGATGDITPTKVTVGTGDAITYGMATAPDKLSVKKGTAAAPDTGIVPLVKVERWISIPGASITGDGVEACSAIVGSAQGTAANEVQPVGVTGIAKSSGTTNPAGTPAPDAVGVYGVGLVLDAGIGVGIGGFFSGRTTSTSGKASGVEANVYNNTGVAGSVATSGYPGTVGVWVTADGNARSGAGIALGNPFGRQFDVGLHFNGQLVGGLTGPVASASIQDDSTSTTAIKIGGTHTNAMTVASTGGKVLIGTTSEFGAASKLEVQATVTSDPLVVYRTTAGVLAHYYVGPSGTIKQFIANGADQFLTGTVAGDGGIRADTASKSFHIGGTASTIEVTNGNALGFFNATTPATKQSVSGSRGGNAALASLLTALATYGLITDGTTA